jgi:group I intron endonuclease
MIIRHGTYIEPNQEGLCGVYRIISPLFNSYVGQSRNIKDRYRKYAAGDCRRQPKIYESIKKYGWDDHRFDILHLCKPEELNYWESYFITLYDTFRGEQGLNSVGGGSGMSDDVRRKISIANTGKKRTAEAIAKISGRKPTRKQLDALRIGALMKNRKTKWSKERNPNSKGVLLIKDVAILEFNSMQAAAIYLGYKRGDSLLYRIEKGLTTKGYLNYLL